MNKYKMEVERMNKDKMTVGAIVGTPPLVGQHAVAPLTRQPMLPRKLYMRAVAPTAVPPAPPEAERERDRIAEEWWNAEHILGQKTGYASEDLDGWFAEEDDLNALSATAVYMIAQTVLNPVVVESPEFREKAYEVLYKLLTAIRQVSLGYHYQPPPPGIRNEPRYVQAEQMLPELKAFQEKVKRLKREAEALRRQYPEEGQDAIDVVTQHEQEIDRIIDIIEGGMEWFFERVRDAHARAWRVSQRLAKLIDSLYGPKYGAPVDEDMEKTKRVVEQYPVK